MKLLYTVVLVAGLGMGCASGGAPVPATYTPADVKTYNASQAIEDLNAFSQTAINLYDAGKLSQDSLFAIRDVVIPVGALVDAYGSGATTLGQAQAFIDNLADPTKELGRLVIQTIRELVDTYGATGSVVDAIAAGLVHLDAVVPNDQSGLRQALAVVVDGINSLKGRN